MSSNSTTTRLDFRPDELLLLRSALRIGRNTAMMSGSPGSQAAMEGMLERLQEQMGDFPKREGSSDTYALADMIRAAMSASVVAVSHPEPDRHMPAHVVVDVDGTRFSTRPDVERGGMPAKAAELAAMLHRFAPVECEVLLETSAELQVLSTERPSSQLPTEAFSALVAERLGSVLGRETADACRVLAHRSYWSQTRDGVHSTTISLLLPVGRAAKAVAALGSGTDADEAILGEHAEPASAPGL